MSENDEGFHNNHVYSHDHLRVVELSLAGSTLRERTAITYVHARAASGRRYAQESASLITLRGGCASRVARACSCIAERTKELGHYARPIVGHAHTTPLRCGTGRSAAAHQPNGSSDR